MDTLAACTNLALRMAAPSPRGTTFARCSSRISWCRSWLREQSPPPSCSAPLANWSPSGSLSSVLRMCGDLCGDLLADCTLADGTVGGGAFLTGAFRFGDSDGASLFGESDTTFLPVAFCVFTKPAVGCMTATIRDRYHDTEKWGRIPTSPYRPFGVS